MTRITTLLYMTLLFAQSTFANELSINQKVLSLNEEAKRILLSGKDLDLAEQKLELSLSLDGKNGETFAGIALIEFKKGNIDVGLNYFLTAIEYDKSLANSKMSKVFSTIIYEDAAKAMKSKNYDLCLRRSIQGFKTGQSLLPLTVIRANCFAAINKPHKALNIYNNAIKRWSNVPDLYLQRAKIFQVLGQCTPMARDLNRFISLNPQKQNLVESLTCDAPIQFAKDTPKPKLI